MKIEDLLSAKTKSIATWFLLFFATLTLSAQTNQTFTSSGSFTVPIGISSIRVECWGAGGGGGSSTTTPAGGGGGGAYAASELTVTPGASYTVTVGSGGSANTAGGNTIFGSNLVVAAGGAGATANTAIGASGGLTASCIGTVSFAGASGGTATTTSGYGGGAAGSTGAATNRTGVSLNGGSGGNSVSSNNNGVAGANYGAGGSGAAATSGSYTGGIGAGGLVVVSWSTASCNYSENTSSGVTFTPSTNYASIALQTISSSLSSHQYFLVNVVKGLNYRIYTTGNPSRPLKMTIYEEGNSGAGAQASSVTNTGNSESTNPNNVYLSFTPTFSGQARVLVNTLADCASTAVSGITAKLTQPSGYNTQDDSTAVGIDSWKGHIYDGIGFNYYLGYYTQTENFREMFGNTGTWPNPNTDDATDFNFYSNGTVRGKTKVTSFSARYRMQSTKTGLYTATLTSDDGQRLFVDGNLIFNNWNDHGTSMKRKVLMPLTGSSQLILDYYEKTGGNCNGFDTLQVVATNNLTTNLTQSICTGYSGSAISGDVIGALPTGISLAGTGYQWAYSTSLGGALTNISGATAASFTPNTSTAPFNTPGTYYLYRKMSLLSTNNVSPNPYTATLNSNAATITINQTITASVSIVASGNMYCNTASATTFTASPTNGGSSPVYQWYVNGVLVGSNSNTYTYTPANNDLVYCSMVSNASPCLEGSPATSNTIQMLVINSSTPVSVSIAASGNPSCSGVPITYTATPVNGGSTPGYQWFKNGIAVGSSSATYTYTPANGDVISCVLTTSVPGCVSGSPATSNSISMTVNPANTITLSSAAGTTSQTVCANSAITNITYSTTGASGASFSGLPAGVTGNWASNLVTISGTPTVAGSYSYTVTLTGGNTCTNTATGTITVNPKPSAPTTTGANISCIGGSAILTASGATGAEIYKWYSASSGGTLLKTSSSNSDNTYTPTGLTSTTTYYVAVVNSYGCESTRTAVVATNTYSTSSDSQASAGTDSWIGHMYDGNTLSTYYGHFTETETFDELFGGQTTCFAVASGAATNSIYTESFSTRFRMNSTRRGLYTVTLGSDDGSRLYIDGTLAYDNWVPQTYSAKNNVLISLSGSSSLAYEFYEGTGNNQVTFNNLTQLTANTLSTNTTQSVCINTLGSTISGDTYGALPAGITASGTGYQWAYSTTLGGALTNIAGATSATFTPDASTAPFNTVGTYYVYRKVSFVSTNNVSPASYTATVASNAATITILPTVVPSVSIVESGNMYCNTASATTFTASPTNGGSSPVYQWYVNGVTVGTNSSTYTYTPANNDQVYCSMLSNAGPCPPSTPVNSNTVQMLVINSATPVSVAIVASANPVCNGTNVTYTATPTNGGTLPAYVWFVNGVSVSSAGNSYSYVPNNNDVVSCVLTSNIPGGCVSGNPATSSITMTVNPANTITLSSAVGTNAQTVCANTAITNIRYNTTGATGATYSGLPAGVSGNWASNQVTLSGTPTVAGTYSYTVTLTGGNSCTNSASGTITVNARPAAPTTTGATLSCIGNSATVSASGAASGEIYKWYTASSGGTLLKTSSSNSDNTYVPTGLTATTSYYVAIVNANGCEGNRTAATVTNPYSNSSDSQTTAGTDSWIGHMYDGLTPGTNYYGHFTEPENFNELFGGATVCFPVSSGATTNSIYTETFAVRFRMNSTRKGLYTATIGSDDGSRLTVDGSSVYSNWVAQGYTPKNNILMYLTGSSSLVLEYYDGGSANQAVFNNLTQLLENTLSANTNQIVCIGSAGAAISGDTFGVLPSGISLNGTGYQWYYSTTPGGARTAISGATSATFTPNGSSAPFNTPGTYYVYRYALLTSTNNVSPASYSPSCVSTNYATIVAKACENYWLGTANTDWGTGSNWRTGSVPSSGSNIEFATLQNYGVVAQNDLQLDQNRSIGNFTNMTTRTLVIPAGRTLTASGTVTTDNDPSRIYIGADASTPNGSLIYTGTPPYATVEMYSMANFDLNQPLGSRYNWQYFGIPVQSVVASPTFDGAYVRKWYEPGTSISNHWLAQNNSSVLTPFTGYEITQHNAKKYIFSGQLVNSNYHSGQLSYTYYSSGHPLNALYPGQHILSNPYTAAININLLDFGNETEQTVYLYNTGTFDDWSGSSDTGENPGQYTAASKQTAGSNGVPGTIPSMQGFLVKAMSNSVNATLNINYATVAAGNSETQRIRQAAAPKVSLSLTLTGYKQRDKVWLFADESCSDGFDNGWDATMVESAQAASRIFINSANASYQISASPDIHNARIDFLCVSEGDYSLTGHTENVDTKYQKLFLYDTETNQMTDMTTSGSKYSFHARKSASATARFRLMALPKDESSASESVRLQAFSVDKTIFVQNSSESVGTVAIYNTAGSKLGEYPFGAQSITAIATHAPDGVYILKAIVDGTEKSLKVILQ